MRDNLKRLTPQTPHALQTLSISSLCQIMRTNKGKEMAEFCTFWVALETFFATTCEVWVHCWPIVLTYKKTSGAFHLLKISGISSSAINGKRFVGSFHWKIPRKSGKSKKVVPFSRLEFPNGISCSIYVSRSLYQFQVHSRAPPRTGVYDQMEQFFTNQKFHFCYHRNFRVFFLNGKRPSFPVRH